MAEEKIRLADIVTRLEMDGADEVIEKLERIKSLMQEINELSKEIFNQKGGRRVAED